MNFKEQYMNLVENMDDKTRYCIFGGILLFVFLLDYFLIMGPQIKMLSEINPKINILSGNIVKAKNDITRITDYKNSVATMKGKLESLNEMIRSKNELSYILSSISEIAQDSGIKIDQIIPNPQDLTLLLEKNQRKYYYLPIIIEARGGYHHFGRFLNRLEREKIALSVSQFALSSTKDLNNHAINLTLNAIVYEE